MGWLIEQFGLDTLRRTPVVLPTVEFFPDRYDASDEAARQLFERICTHMGADAARMQFTLFSQNHRGGFARDLVREDLGWVGLYSSEEGRPQVRVDRAYLSDQEVMVATIAHELAHVRLLGEQRIDPTVCDHELLTDLTTVFFGMGVINANMAKRRQWIANRRGDFTRSLGYLTPNLWAYGLALFAWLRQESDPQWMKALRLAVGSPCRKNFKYLMATGDAHSAFDRGLDDEQRRALLSRQYPEFGIPSEPERDDDSRWQPPQSALEEAAQHEILDAGEDTFLQGSMLLKAGRWEEAIEAFSATIELQPDDGESYQHRAWAYLELGRVAEALADADAAVEWSPDDIDSYLARGIAYVQVGKFDAAIEDLDRYVDKEDTFASSGVRASRAYYFRGLAFEGMDEANRAVADFTTAMYRWPGWPEPYEARARVYEQLGRPDKAAADRETASRREL